MKDVITKEYVFNHPIADVWKAISDEKEISAWFIQADFKPEAGYKYKFKHEENGKCTNIDGEVLEANPVHKLVYTWVVRGTEAVTTVTWQLEEAGEGTKLTLTHSGISNYPTEEVATKMFENFSGGWDNCINMLDKHLKKEVHA